jgi:hypothetical protein
MLQKLGVFLHFPFVALESIVVLQILEYFRCEPVSFRKDSARLISMGTILLHTSNHHLHLLDR